MSCLDSMGCAAPTRLEELAAPYEILTKAGHTVTIASVKGGKIPLDPTSMQKANITAQTQDFLDNSAILIACNVYALLPVECNRHQDAQVRPHACAEKSMELLENSVPIAGLSADDFDAIYIPGGHGVAVDGPCDLYTARAHQLLRRIRQAGVGRLPRARGPVRTRGRRQAHRGRQEGSVNSFYTFLHRSP